MKRIILDTNIYGRIVEKRQEEEIRQIIERHHGVIIYGFDVVRKELRAVSKDVRSSKKLVRLMLLGIYDKLIKSHNYFTTSAIVQLSGEYYSVYRELGGKESEKEMLNDFLIVACASIHELDIVVSDDNETMLSDNAIKAYRIINSLKKYRTPEFIGYGAFWRLLA
ncbi:MAG TPA: hypothetical protein VJI12_00980 [archaeon]|nr:hypothetical protein [archaeon]